LENIALTVFSFGAGQESTYLLHKLLTDDAYYTKHVQGKLLVVGSDTGDEHPHTYENIERMHKLCYEKGVAFHWLPAGDEFHGETWPSLTDQYKANKAIGSAAYRQTCTDNLKVKVVDRKGAYHRFYKNHGAIRLILGFAKGEEKRTANGNKFDAVWKKKTVIRYYPLIIDGVDRQQCIDYNEATLPFKVWPSNCMRCFYQSDHEVLWLFRFYPAKFWEWVRIEKTKMTKYDKADPPVINLGVYGKITLVQKLNKAIKLYGHWTDDQLNEYKYSHGHCIKSRY
jgi:hypothetical protein